jgi:hypothetical protein
MPHFSACLKPRPRFSSVSIVVIGILRCLRLYYLPLIYKCIIMRRLTFYFQLCTYVKSFIVFRDVTINTCLSLINITRFLSYISTKGRPYPVL